jgi:hypothetical protein
MRKREQEIGSILQTRRMECDYNLTPKNVIFHRFSPLGPNKYKIIHGRTLLANVD